MAVAASLYLDHVEMTVVRENSVHFTVQLLEGGLNGVSLQYVAALIFTEVMMTCKTREDTKKRIQQR